MSSMAERCDNDISPNFGPILNLSIYAQRLRRILSALKSERLGRF